jgi:hypothetical protein
MPCTALKIVVVAQTPSAMQVTATAVNAGLRRSVRAAKRTSRTSSSQRSALLRRP